jgi:hypothetical protein
MTTLHTPEFLFKDAEELLSAAEYELHRPQENNALHLACNNARLSITHYLIGYLLEHDIRIKSPASIASLQQQCQIIDPRFSVLNLDNINCRYDRPGLRFCTQADRVTACYEAALQLQSIIMDPVMA